MTSSRQASLWQYCRGVREAETVPEAPISQFLPRDRELNIIVVEGAVLYKVQQKYCTAEARPGQKWPKLSSIKKTQTQSTSNTKGVKTQIFHRTGKQKKSCVEMFGEAGTF